MVQLTISIDERTRDLLRQLSDQAGTEPAEVASRLLARAVGAQRPRPTYDLESLTRRYAEFVEEDETLAESGQAERADLLAEEDVA